MTMGKLFRAAPARSSIADVLIFGGVSLCVLLGRSDGVCARQEGERGPVPYVASPASKATQEQNGVKALNSNPKRSASATFVTKEVAMGRVTQRELSPALVRSLQSLWGGMMYSLKGIEVVLLPDTISAANFAGTSVFDINVLAKSEMSVELVISLAMADGRPTIRESRVVGYGELARVGDIVESLICKSMIRAELIKGACLDPAKLKAKKDEFARVLRQDLQRRSLSQKAMIAKSKMPAGTIAQELSEQKPQLSPKPKNEASRVAKADRLDGPPPSPTPDERSVTGEGASPPRAKSPPDEDVPRPVLPTSLPKAKTAQAAVPHDLDQGLLDPVSAPKRLALGEKKIELNVVPAPTMGSPLPEAKNDGEGRQRAWLKNALPYLGVALAVRTAGAQEWGRAQGLLGFGTELGIHSRHYGWSAGYGTGVLVVKDLVGGHYRLATQVYNLKKRWWRFNLSADSTVNPVLRSNQRLMVPWISDFGYTKDCEVFNSIALERYQVESNLEANRSGSNILLGLGVTAFGLVQASVDLTFTSQGSLVYQGVVVKILAGFIL